MTGAQEVVKETAEQRLAGRTAAAAAAAEQQHKWLSAVEVQEASDGYFS